MGNTAPSVAIEDEEDLIRAETKENKTDSAAVEEEILMQGYLMKESAYLKKLKKKWFVLKGNHLNGWKTQTDYDSNLPAIKSIDLSIYHDITTSKNKKRAQFELVSSEPQSNKILIAESMDDMHRWMDVINPVMISPKTAIHIVFERISKNVGMDDNNMQNSLNTFTTQLCDLWYYRAIDLLHIDQKLLNELKIPITLQNQVNEYVKIWRKYALFTQFEEAVPKSNNITHLLNDLKAANESQSAAGHIQILQQTFEELWLLNINKIKLYFSKTEWDNLNIPSYLKLILLQKIHHSFEENENKQNAMSNEEKEGEALYPDLDELKRDLQNITAGHDEVKINVNAQLCDSYDIEPTYTLQKVANLLSHSLFVPEKQIKKYLQAFIEYKYNRMYSLSFISHELYHELMSVAPNCLKLELFNIMAHCKKKMSGNALPFYEYRKISNANYVNFKEIEIDWTMSTVQVFKLLECDLNLKKDALLSDCNTLMNNFYSNLWDWFFIPVSMWKTLKHYNKYQSVRIRIHDLMSECGKKYNVKKQMPAVPSLWLDKYNKDLPIEQLLFGGDNNQFSFDGLRCNDEINEKVQLINKYLLENYVAKLEFVPNQHAQNNEVWTKYMNQHNIPPHIRFKINFYAIKGNIQTDDDWLNNYIQNSNYPMFAPQFKQTILLPMLFVENITDMSAKISFYSEPDFDCYIEMAYDEEKESKWDFLTVVYNDERTYLCDDLRRHTAYKLRAKYKNHTRFTEVVPFKTKLPAPPVFVVENIDSISMTVQFTLQSELECDVEIMDIENVKSSWERLATFKNQTEYLCQHLESNNSYRIRARYKDEFVSSNYSQSTAFHTLPQRPKVSIRNQRPTSAELVFSNMSQLVCCVEMADDEKRSNWKQITTFSNRNSYLCNDLQPNHSYKIRAKYKSEFVESFYSKRVSFITLPNAPLLTVENVATTSAKVKLLNAVRLDCEIEIMDTIDRCDALGLSDWISCHRTFANQTTYLCTDLDSGSSYQLRARYENESGYSDYSDIVSLDTLPEAPRCSVEGITETTATIRFRKSSRLQCYIEMYDDMKAMWDEINVISNTTRHELVDLKSNQTYKVRAKRKSKNTFSDYSNILVFTTVPKPPTFTMENVQDTTAQLTLPIQSHSDCHIEIAEAGNEECKWYGIAIFSNQKVQLCTNLKYGTCYKIRAKYENESGCSRFSEISSFTTQLPVPPCLLRIENITSKSATLIFSDAIIFSLECSVEIALDIDDEKKTNWKESGTFSNKHTYLCSNLERDRSYKMRAKYKDYEGYGAVQQFKTSASWSDILGAEECTKLQELVDSHTNNEYKPEWKCLYRASEHGFTAHHFYNKCHMKANTICMVQCAKTKNIFGAFTTCFWDKSQANCQDKQSLTDSDAFTYLLRSEHGSQAAIFPVRRAWRSAVAQQSGYFLMFGHSDSDDPNVILQLSDDCDVNEDSYAFIDEKGDESYAVPDGYQLTEDGYFRVQDVEVWQLFGKTRKYNGGNKLQWQSSKVEQWDNDDIIHWLTSLTLQCMVDEDYYSLLQEVKECCCIGEDLVMLESAQDFSESFAIDNDELCDALFEQIGELVANCAEWKSTAMEEWSNEDILSWINSMNVEQQYSAMIVSVLTDNGCVGEDLVCLECAQEIGEAFGIEGNQLLCEQLFSAILSIRASSNVQQQQNDDVDADAVYGGHETAGNVEVAVEVEPERKYESELDYSWKAKRIKHWSNAEILDWIKCMNLGTAWNAKILNVIATNGCTGEDIVELASADDVGEAFEIEDAEISQKICEEMQNLKAELDGNDDGLRITVLYQNENVVIEEVALTDKIKKIKTLFRAQVRIDFELKHIHFKYKKQELSNNKTLRQCGITKETHVINVKLDDVFAVYINAQGNTLILEQKVTKKCKILKIKKMYKKQSGVFAGIDEIQFYSKSKLLQSSKTLAMCGIVDDKHLISVKFETDGGGK